MSKVIHDLKLLDNKVLSPYYRRLDFQAPESLPRCLPGQFAELEVPPGPGIYLRRPFSIHDVDYQKNTISFLIKLVGEGTRRLGTIQAGTLVNTIYPLGNGFSAPGGEKVLLVGGGCGIAPLLFLARHLVPQGIQPDSLLGGRGAADLVETDDFAAAGNLFLTTEDGSLGERGFVTHHSAWQQVQDYSMIYACGPEAMLRSIALIAQEAGIPCEVSLENTMACGLGVCLCCVVNTTTGHRCVCSDGPVFNVTGLIGWNEIAETAETCPII